jgi:hypothetical protein
MAILDSISLVRLASFSFHANKMLEIFTFFGYFLSIVIYNGNSCLQIFITSTVSTLIFMSRHLSVSINLVVRPCTIISFLASSTISAMYYTVRIPCSPTLKSPDSSIAPLVRFCLYELNRIGDKQRPCIIPLPIFLLLVSPPSSRTFQHSDPCTVGWSIFFRHSIPVPFRNWIDFDTLHTQPNISLVIIDNQILWRKSF